MIRVLLLVVGCLVTGAGVSPAGEDSWSAETRRQGPVRFEKRVLTDRYYCDGITAGDINGDGVCDVVAGPYWYAGPDFDRAYEFYAAVPLPREPSPSNSMFSFVHDFNGDGRADILVLGRVHKHPAVWYENPGPTEGLWPAHIVFERIRGESPVLCHLTDAGRPQLITHWEGRWGYLTPDAAQPAAPWKFTAVGDDEDWPQFYHGQGVADLNGDRRLDLLLNDGWYGQPAVTRPAQPWTFHRGTFSRGRGGAQMFADDVDGDGDADVITALDAHGWGLAWFELLSGVADSDDPELRHVGDRWYRRHLIMSDRSREQALGAAFTQPHALALADIDGDGHRDIVTGKRMWAHGPTGDIEPNAAPVLYWFQWTRDVTGNVRFRPHRIDDSSGVGVQLTVADVNADDRPDILTVSKLGTFVFLSSP